MSSEAISTQMPLATMLSGMRSVLALHAESAALRWPDGPKRIMEIAAEQDQLTPFDRPREPAFKMQGFYPHYENLGSVWVIGDVQPDSGLAFLWAAADFIAGHFNADGPYPLNAQSLAMRYGADAAKELMDIVEDAANAGASREHRRYELQEQDDDGTPLGKPRYARLDTEQAEFIDEGVYAMECAPDDEGATLITILELDDDLYCALEALIERKDAAAAVVRRLPVAAEQTS